ncbi:MAG: carboxypeptidase regulatory-like domain-containing protein, partial [Blastocatellia bacterium]|nr:carboxypeptidase regulatory-like domain-containing protein [Blastocatellia bacterium]
MRILLIFLLSPLVFAQAQNNSPHNSSISGRITVDGTPATNIKISATEIKGEDQSSSFSAQGLSPVEKQGASAVTDADGRYRITGLQDGKYAVKVESGAFVPAKQGAGSSRRVALDENQEAKNIDFSLVRGGVITGRITDSQGRPLIDRQVRLQFVSEDGQKRDHNAQFGSDMFTTDDRGVYRLYGLPPGRYILSSGSAEYGIGGRRFPTTYYPGVISEDQAGIIEVKEAGEVSGIDLALGALSGYEALGRVIDAENGTPIAQANLVCFARGDDDRGPTGFSGNAKTDAQGNFRFAGLPSGKYSISLSPDTDILTGGSEYYIDSAGFEVAEGNLAGIEIRARHGSSISGVVAPENNAALQNKFGQMVLSASVTKKDDEQSSNDPFSGQRTAKIGNDGQFRISGLRPGVVDFGLFTLIGGNPTISRVERDGADTGGKIEIRPGESISGVKIVVAFGTGVIRGQVDYDKDLLPEGSQIIVYANRNGARDKGSQQTSVDSKGRFAIQGLADGDYEVVVQALNLVSSTQDPATLPRATE